MENHISFLCDDHPDSPDSLRLHILATDDYHLAIGKGIDWPVMRNAFRVRTSGARDHRVTALISALYKMGRGDNEGAIRSAEAFIEEVRRDI